MSLPEKALPIGGGYLGKSNVISIPVADPRIKAIAGAIFKPEGAGPFPAMIYMSGCAGLTVPQDEALQKQVIDHYTGKGLAVLIVDPFSVREEWSGVCASVNETNFAQMGARGGEDVWAAVAALRQMPSIDSARIFVQGYSWGAISSLFAVDRKNPNPHEGKIAGLVAYYPNCYASVDPSVPTLVLIGDKDDWTPAAACQAVKDKPNMDVVVFAGQTHAFVMPGLNTEFLGHRMVYDANAAEEAQKRADAFLAQRMQTAK